ncbi:MAG: AAA family ATPase [Kosmotoga sp.]|nr:MAG: AAA family ATPase [Kosmotoga sp.]
MITRIKRVKNFGIFDDFSWKESCKDFHKYNFFYGWNYSGKTTLSRIFRCIEKQKNHEDYPNAQFSLRTDNEIINQKNITSNELSVRVFNEDFIEENFHWNDTDSSIDPVLILGEESKKLNDGLTNLITLLSKENVNFKEIKEKIETKENELETSLRTKATAIRQIIGITNPREFDKNKLREQISKMNKVSFEQKILDDPVKELSFFRKEKRKTIKQFVLPKLQLKSFIVNTRSLLSKKITAEKFIEKLSKNEELRDWVEKGVEIHKNEKNCQFCGNPLPPGLLYSLKKYFTSERENLKLDINKLLGKIENHIKEIEEISFPGRETLIDKLQKKYEVLIDTFNEQKKEYKVNLYSLEEKLKFKRNDPYKVIEMDKCSDNSSKMKEVFEDTKKVIEKHNSTIDKYETIKENSKEKLISHYCAEFIKEIDYFGSLQKINDLKTEQQTIKTKIDVLKNGKKNIEKKIKAEEIGAELINKYLSYFFSDDKIKITTTQDSKYKISRKDKIAKNLSTGEKNIISLVYFFAKLEETSFNLEDSVIFIDDPVSSLDSNHIFRMYVFIKEKLITCGQLFITTHNFNFLNLLKDIGQHAFKNGNCNFFLIKRIKKVNKLYCCIEQLPEVLFKYRSEYNYLFSIIKNFYDSSDKSSFEMIHIMPNILRRFLELFLNMKYPDNNKLGCKVNKYLRNLKESEISLVLKILNQYSHEDDVSHSQKFPEIQELEESISIVLKTIQNKDIEHYETLCNTVK